MGDSREARLTAFRASLSICADAQHDQFWIDLQERLETQPPLFQGSWAEVFQHHVRLCYQLPEQIGALLRAEIEGNRLFVSGLTEPDHTVAALGRSTKFPKGISPRGLFDLNDLSAEIGKDGSAEWSCNESSDVQYTDTSHRLIFICLAQFEIPQVLFIDRRMEVHR
ncbi:hypothetical protein D3C85_1168480 [compost metagenome]